MAGRLRMGGKTRPVLILSVSYAESDYALFAAVPHTTTPRGSQFEVTLNVPGLKTGAFNVQGLLAVPPAKCVRKLTRLTPKQLQAVESVVLKWLGFHL